jgi:hypothetical protein
MKRRPICLATTHVVPVPQIVFPPDSIGAYLDFRTQEIGVAAAHSDDQALKLAYQSGDVYHALARTTGYPRTPVLSFLS